MIAEDVVEEVDGLVEDFFVGDDHENDSGRRTIAKLWTVLDYFGQGRRMDDDIDRRTEDNCDRAAIDLEMKNGGRSRSPTRSRF